MLETMMTYLPYAMGAGAVMVWPTPFMWMRGLAVNALKRMVGLGGTKAE